MSVLNEQAAKDRRNGHSPGDDANDFTTYAQRLGALAEAGRIEVPGGGVPRDADGFVENYDHESGLAGNLDKIIHDIENPPLEFKSISSKELAEGDYEIEYLVDGLLVCGQPGGIFGGKKSLKTTLSIELALSLSIGSPFLGQFKVTRAVRVGVMSGESGAATIQETARRIANAKGRTLDDFTGVRWCFDLPTLGDAAHLLALEQFITGNELEVLFIDPSYLCMPVADAAGNLFVVGGMLKGLTEIGQRTGCTILVCHHTKKGLVDPFAAPELEDIAWAGFQEWCRQWLLVGRREKYDPEQGGDHKLWLNCGGSAGHSSLWALNIAEGTRQDAGGRYWGVEVLKASEARAEAADAEQDAKETAKEQKRQTTLAKDMEKVLKTVSKFPDGESKTTIRDTSGLHTNRFSPAFAALLEERKIEPCTLTKNRRQIDGYKPSGTSRDNPGQAGNPEPSGPVGIFSPIGGNPVPTGAECVTNELESYPGCSEELF